MNVVKEKIHILDKDVKRRAKIAFGLSERNYRAQIYENLEEILSFPPVDGLLLVNDSFVGREISEVADAIASSVARVPVVMFGEKPSTDDVVQAILAGAVDYLEWPFDPDRVDEAIAKVDRDPSLQVRVIERRRSAMARLQALSERERDVLRRMIQGYGSKDIGTFLEISPRTVEVHRASVLAKLKARSTSDAIRIGIYGGLDD